MRAFGFTLGLLFSLGQMGAAFGADLSGMTSLSDGEMSNLRGGFEVPGGLQIAIGLDVGAATTLANALAPTSSGGAPAATAALSQVNGVPNVLGIVQPNTGASNQLVQNSLDNVTIQQVTKLNVDVLNYSQIKPQLSPLTQLLSLSQLSGSLSGLPH